MSKRYAWWHIYTHAWCIIYACEKCMHVFSEIHAHQKYMISISEIFLEIYASQKCIICMPEIYTSIFRNMSQINLVCRFSRLWSLHMSPKITLTRYLFLHTKNHRMSFQYHKQSLVALISFPKFTEQKPVLESIFLSSVILLYLLQIQKTEVVVRKCSIKTEFLTVS